MFSVMVLFQSLFSGSSLKLTRRIQVCVPLTSAQSKQICKRGQTPPFLRDGPVIAADISIKASLPSLPIFNDQRGASSSVGTLTAVIKSATEANAVHDSDDSTEGAHQRTGARPANRFSRTSMMEINLSSKQRV